jgi:HK97 family phage major capsid protein
MKHLAPLEVRSALPIETRQDPDPLAAATAAVEELRTAATEAQARHETEVRGLTERIAALETRANRPGTGTEPTEPSPERRAFAAYLRLGDATSADERRSLNESSSVAGGYLAPPEMVSEIIRALVEFSPMRAVASVRTTTAPSVIYPTVGELTNGAWVGEGQQVPGSELTFGQVEIPIREYGTFVDISNRLLADATQAETEVRSAFAVKFGKTEALAFLWGQGPLEPAGLMRNTDIEYTANGHAANLSADALITLLYAQPATYRNSGSWAMNGKTLAAVRKLKDGDGRFLWQQSYAVGQPETLLGRPVVEMVDMPDIASDAFPVIYGDFSGYRIVDRIGLDFLSDPYTRRGVGLTRLHANRRVGGGVLQPAKFRKLKMATS